VLPLPSFVHVDGVRCAWHAWYGRHGNDQHGQRKASGIWLAGRIILNVWRLMRSEMKLPIYTFENVVFNALHERTPKYSAEVRNPTPHLSYCAFPRLLFVVR